MEDFVNFVPPQEVSYLQARDPSILSWNRHGIDKVRHNLVNDFESESTIPSIPSDKEDNLIKVYLRIKGGVEDYSDLYTVEDDALLCRVPVGSNPTHGIKKYKFSQIFGPETTQQNLFNTIVKPKILHFINGYDCTLLAYGASGAGKTFTMIGTVEDPGLIPRALEYLFRSIPPINAKPNVKPLPDGNVMALNGLQTEAEYQKLLRVLPQAHGERSLHVRTYEAMQQRLSNVPVATVTHTPPVLAVYVSIIEIYNEFVYDLLQPPPLRGQQRSKLKIGGLQDQIYIKGLEYVFVRSGLEAYQVLQYGINNLKYAETALNMHSSRSHCIFTIRLVQGRDVTNSIVSTFNFCDLAGSERSKKTGNVGDRLKESNNINCSLLVLGRCISTIRDGQCSKENKMPPFRESKLTQLFQRALMGKENILMIVNINPNRNMLEESQHTLNFAGIAKQIVMEEPVRKILNINRFSRSLEQDMMSYIVDDESHEELRNEIARLTLELSELRQHHEEELEEERQHLRRLFGQMLDIREEQIKTLEKENKKLRDEIKPNVIIISDSESDEEDQAMSSLRQDNQILKTDIYNLKEVQEQLKEEIKQKDIELAQVKAQLTEAELTVEDSKTSFREILEEMKKLRSDNFELEKKYLLLKDKFDLQEMELEGLLRAASIDKENIEMLQEENQVLLDSICNEKSNVSSEKEDKLAESSH